MKKVNSGRRTADGAGTGSEDACAAAMKLSAVRRLSCTVFAG